MKLQEVCMECLRRIVNSNNSCIEDAKSRYKIVNGDVCNFCYTADTENK